MKNNAKNKAESYDYDLLCIGSGPAGQHAAIQAAKLGKRAAVIERRRIVGGTCLESGTIPSKTFREAVLSFINDSRPYANSPGIVSEGRPSAEQLLARVNEVIQIEGDVLEYQLRRNDVTMIRGDASFKDDHTVQVLAENEIRAFRSANILVAVGTIPSPPLGIPADGEVIINSDGVLELKRLPRTMAVVGAGFIGMEYASMFAALGIEVTVVDMQERPLEFLDREIVDELIHQMRNKQVTFRLGEAVEHLEIAEGPPRRAVMNLVSGKRLVSDLALFSAGRLGATDSLTLSAAGLQSDERGRLKVDEHFRTQVPHIYAAGDVIGHPSLAATSSEQGRLVACHAFGVETESIAIHFPIGIYSIPEISTVGDAEHELTAKKIPYETGIARYRETARGGIMGDTSGFLKMLFDRVDQRLLGVHIMGPGATELVHIGQAIMETGNGLQYFLKTVFNYPTLAECYKVAALDAYNKLSQ